MAEVDVHFQGESHQPTHTMKRFLSIITLITTLGFVLPTSAEAAKHKTKHKKSGHSNSQPQQRLQQQLIAPQQRSAPSPSPRHSNGPIFYSNRHGPVVIQRVPRRAPVGPRRSLLEFLLRR